MVTAVTERVEHGHRITRTPSVWTVILAVVLLLAAGFGAGFLVSEATQSEPAGLADESVVALIDDSIAASNAGDDAAYAATFSSDAKFFIIDDGIELARYEFPNVIARETGGTVDLALTSEVVQHGDYASVSYTEAGSHGLMVVEIVGGKIDNQWIFIDEYK
jgi:hypothetical protein